jgi:hypothetical protein
MRCAPECNIELMPQEKVLDFKLPPRTEQQIDYEHREELNECPNPHGWNFRERQS